MLKKKNHNKIFCYSSQKKTGKKASQHKANLIIKFLNIKVSLIFILSAYVKSSEMQQLENRMEKHRKALGTVAHNL